MNIEYFVILFVIHYFVTQTTNIVQALHGILIQQHRKQKSKSFLQGYKQTFDHLITFVMDVSYSFVKLFFVFSGI